MIQSDDDPEGLRNTPQEDLALDPADHDSSANHDLETMRIDPAALFEQALEQTRMAISLTDPHQPDQPMIYVNQAFLELTGYEREEVVGVNCRLLQGAETDPASVEEIRRIIASREVGVVEILNYRKDGSSFWNSLHIGPVYDDDGNLTHYYGSQWDVTKTVGHRRQIALNERVAEELQHRIGNLFNVIASMLRLSARGETDIEALVGKVEKRILALGQAHRVSLSGGGEGDNDIDLHDLVSAILDPYREDGNRRIVLSGELTSVPRDAVTPLGLMLHELATNALKYGAFSVPNGEVTVEWRIDGDDLRLEWRERGGPEVRAPDRTGTGSSIMQGVLKMIGAEISHEWPPTGLTATLVMKRSRGV